MNFRSIVSEFYHGKDLYRVLMNAECAILPQRAGFGRG